MSQYIDDRHPNPDAAGESGRLPDDRDYALREPPRLSWSTAIPLWCALAFGGWLMIAAIYWLFTQLAHELMAIAWPV